MRRRLASSFLKSGAALVASAVTMLALSRYVAPSEYGRYSVILSVWGILATFIRWCGGLLMRFGPVEFQSHGHLRKTISARLFFAIPVAPIILVLVPLYLSVGRGWSSILIISTIVWLVATLGFDVLEWSAVAVQEFSGLSLATAISKAAPLAIVALCLVRPFTVTAQMILAVMTIGLIVGDSVLFIALRRYLGFGALDKTLVRDMWVYIRSALIAVPATAAIAWMDPILLDHWATRADVGQYQLAYPTFTIFAALGAAFNSVLSPELVTSKASSDAKIHAYARRLQPRVATASSLLAFASACVARPILIHLLPQSYYPTADLVAILCIAGGSLCAFWSLHPLVTATDAMAYLQVSTIVQAVVNVGLDVALARKFGAKGVAFANVCAWTTAYACLSLSMKRRAPVAMWPVPIIVGAAILGSVALYASTFAIRLLVAVACTLGAAYAGGTILFERKNSSRPKPT